MASQQTSPQRRQLSAALRLAVLRALPFEPPGLTPKGVRHAIANMWAPATISGALGVLVHEGVVQAEGEPGRRRYWRIDLPAERGE